MKIKNIIAALSMMVLSELSYAENNFDSQIQQLQQQVIQLQDQMKELNNYQTDTKNIQTVRSEQVDIVSQKNQEYIRTNSNWTQQMTNNQKITNRDLTILKARNNGELESNSIYLGGKGELDLVFTRESANTTNDASNQTQLMMPFVDIVFTAAIGDWITGFADLQVGSQFGTPATGQNSGSNGQNSNVTLPQAFFTLGNDIKPLFATLGVKVIDFGDFRNENNIIPTLTEFSFMAQGGQLAGGVNVDGITLTASIMNGGGIAQTNASTENNQAINNFAINLGYSGEYGHVGIGYINGTGFNKNGASDCFNAICSNPSNPAPSSENSANGRVGAVTFNAGLDAEKFKLNSDFVFTTQTVNGLNNSSAFNTSGSNVNGYFPLTLLLGTGVQPGQLNAVNGNAFNGGKTLMSWDLNGSFNINSIEEHNIKVFGSYSQMYQESDNNIYQFVVGARINVIETLWIGPSYQYFSGKLTGTELQATNTILVDITAYF